MNVSEMFILYCTDFTQTSLHVTSLLARKCTLYTYANVTRLHITFNCISPTGRPKKINEKESDKMKQTNKSQVFTPTSLHNTYVTCMLQVHVYAVPYTFVYTDVHVHTRAWLLVIIK
jgi:hypothetical protein